MSKIFKVLCFAFIMGLFAFSLVSCSDSKTLSEDQYEISRQGKNFTVKVPGNDISGKDIETVKVKIRYKYTHTSYSNGSLYADDIGVKTKTETFVVKKSDSSSGSFTGSFSVIDPVFEFDCKKVVAYYGDGEQQASGDFRLGILEAMACALGCCIFCVIAWFVLGLFMDVNRAFVIASTPNCILFLGLLVTGQWIPAIVFLLSVGVSLTIARAIYNKLCS